MLANVTQDFVNGCLLDDYPRASDVAPYQDYFIFLLLLSAFCTHHLNRWYPTEGHVLGSKAIPGDQVELLVCDAAACGKGGVPRFPVFLYSIIILISSKAAVNRGD